MQLDWEEKFAAINAIGEAHLCMRKPGDWYIDQPVTVKTNEGTLRSTLGNGQTPEESVEAYWLEITEELKGGEYLVFSALGGTVRKAVRWNGFMWADVAEPPRDQA